MFLNKCRRLSAKNFFGFSRGHQELSREQLAVLADIIGTDLSGSGSIVADYEKQLGSLIGDGEAKSFLAGRMAFYVLLKALNIGPGDEVILPAFTCAVMPNAVWRAGATPVFADIDPATFGSAPGDIEKKITGHTRMIVAQHSFGVPCRIEEIVKIARERSVFLLEDSALALDSSRDGIKVGNWGDAAFFSTDHTKPLNTIVGGFLYTRNRELFAKIREIAENIPSLGHEHQGRLYEQFLFERRYYSPQKYGRSIMVSKWRSLARRLSRQGSVFLESDYCRNVPSGHDYPYPARMPAFLAQLGLYELEAWPKERVKRKEILKEYIQMADDLGLREFIPGGYLDKRNDIVPLRFAFSTPRAEQMKKAIGRFLDTDQFWFQSTVICCPQGPESLGYIPGSCPNAEQASRSIINWPCVLSDHSKEIFLTLLKGVL
jgi:perosamine synthetase